MTRVEVSDLIVCARCHSIAWVIRYQAGSPPLLHCRVCTGSTVKAVTQERLDRHLEALDAMRRGHDD